MVSSTALISRLKGGLAFSTEHQISSSPAVSHPVLRSVDGKLYCSNIVMGTSVKFETPAPITGSAAIFDDIVYVGSTDHHIYALLA
jgi:outer membrane protein assembly factor BamB